MGTEVVVNYWAVFFAAVSSMVVGSIWYAPSVFGKVWGKLAKVKMDGKSDNKEMTRLMGLTFIGSLITAYVLAHVAFLSHHFFDNDFLQDALSTAFWLWLGFTAVRFMTHDLFEGRPTKLTFLNAAHELVTFLSMALIIGAVGIK